MSEDEGKRKASFQIQQYDNITFPQETETTAQGFPYETVHVVPKTHFKIEEITEHPGYSKLSHPGPRLSQTKRQEQRSREKVKQKDRAASLSAVRPKDDSSSEVQSSSRPSSQIISTNGGKSIFDGKDNLPPPVASRPSISKSVEKTQKSSDKSLVPPVAEAYEIVPLPNAVETTETDNDIDMSEFRPSYAVEKALADMYELVNH